MLAMYCTVGTAQFHEGARQRVIPSCILAWGIRAEEAHWITNRQIEYSYSHREMKRGI